MTGQSKKKKTKKNEDETKQNSINHDVDDSETTKTFTHTWYGKMCRTFVSALIIIKNDVFGYSHLTTLNL